MADDVQVYDVTCPASRPPTSPLEVTTIPASQFVVVKVWLIIPDGHAGLTGIALAFGHQPVIPSNPGAFISGNDEEFYIPLRGYPVGVPWSVFLCNNDNESHSWETRWELEFPPTPPGGQPPQTVQPADVYTAGDTTDVAL